MSHLRIDLLGDVISDQLDTHAKFSAKEPTTIIRVSGEHDTVKPEEATATDWLRLLLREEALCAPARRAAVKAQDAMKLDPGEALSVAANRLVRVYRAAAAKADRPHASEATYFWRYASVDNIKDLISRFCEIVKPVMAAQDTASLALCSVLQCCPQEDDDKAISSTHRVCSCIST